MYAKLKQSYFLNVTTACGGLDITKVGWTFIPAHEEDSAKANPDLELVDQIP
jgi:hypothetical protein